MAQQTVRRRVYLQTAPCATTRRRSWSTGRPAHPRQSPPPPPCPCSQTPRGTQRRRLHAPSQTGPPHRRTWHCSPPPAGRQQPMWQHDAWTEFAASLNDVGLHHQATGGRGWQRRCRLSWCVGAVAAFVVGSRGGRCAQHRAARHRGPRQWRRSRQRRRGRGCVWQGGPCCRRARCPASG